MSIWLDASYMERFFQAATLMLTAAIAAVYRRPRPTLVIVGLAGMAMWGPLQLLAGWSTYPYVTGIAALRWISLVAAFFLTHELLDDRRRRQQARTALAIFGAVLAVYATAQAYTSNGQYLWLFPSGQPEVFGPFQNKNNYAAFIELTLPLTLWEGLKPGRYRILWLTMAGVMAASVVAAASRAGSALVMMEILAVFAVAYLSSQFPRREIAITAATMATLTAFSILVTGWETLGQRLIEADPFVNRREMLQSALEMAKDRPWTGFGLGTFPVVYPAYAYFDIGLYVNHAHNDWAEWAAEGGLPFIFLLGTAGAVSSVVAIRSGWGMGLVAVYLHGLVDFPMQRTGVVVWVFVIGGMLAAEYWRRPEKLELRGYVAAQGE